MTRLTTVGVLLLAGLAFAQNPNPPTGFTPAVVSQPTTPPPPGHVPAKTGRPAVTTLPNPHKKKLDSPGHPDNSPAPSQVKTKLDEFKAAREKYLAGKKSLTLNRDDLTEAQRQVLLEAQKAIRDDFQQRRQEIKDEFHNKELSEVIDAARKAAADGHKRKGDD